MKPGGGPQCRHGDLPEGGKRQAKGSYPHHLSIPSPAQPLSFQELLWNSGLGWDTPKIRDDLTASRDIRGLMRPAPHGAGGCSSGLA